MSINFHLPGGPRKFVHLISNWNFWGYLRPQRPQKSYISLFLFKYHIAMVFSNLRLLRSHFSRDLILLQNSRILTFRPLASIEVWCQWHYIVSKLKVIDQSNLTMEDFDLKFKNIWELLVCIGIWHRFFGSDIKWLPIFECRIFSTILFVARLEQDCCKIVVIQDCFRIIARLLQVCYALIQDCCKMLVIQDCFRMLQDCCRIVARLL